MSSVQHLLSSGRTTYQVFLFSTIITILLTIVGLLLSLFLYIPPRFRGIMWFPSFWILGWLTDVSLTIVEPTSVSTGVFPFVISAIIFFLLLYVLMRIKEPVDSNPPTWSLLWPNFMLLVLGMAFTASVSNTNRSLHYEMKVERMALHGDYDLVMHPKLQEGHKSTSISSLRAYFLSKYDKLGDMLFMYPQTLSPQTLLPPPVDSLRPYHLPRLLKEHLGDYPDNSFDSRVFLQRLASDSIVKEPVKDYLLCAYLLDRDLPVFSDSLISIYGPRDSVYIEMQLKAKKKNAQRHEDRKKNRKGKKLSNSTKDKSEKKEPKEVFLFHDLPRYYAEAIVLHHALCDTARSDVADGVLLKRYLDFDRLRRSEKQYAKSRERCKEKHGDTYWFYYFFEK